MTLCPNCKKEVASASVKFCVNCGTNLSAAAASNVSSTSASSTTFSAPTPAAQPLSPNTAKIPMDEHEFKDFIGSISRGLMKDKDQITKIKAAASAHHFTCVQALDTINHVKGHPVEALIALYPAIVDASVENFSKVLLGMKWIEERQEVITGLKLDAAAYASVLKK